MARTLEGAQQLAATMCGSPAFMAPEVFLLRQQGRDGYDDKADLWSVGCILYYMRTKGMVTPAQNHHELTQQLKAAIAKEQRERRCVRELPPTIKAQQECPGTVQDYKAESEKLRGWRVRLAQQAGGSEADLKVVKVEKRPTRGGAKPQVVLTYELRLAVSDACVRPWHPSHTLFSLANDWLT